MEAANAGKIALYLILPIKKTSSPNNAPAKGVPKTEPNPAAIAAIIKIARSLAFSLKGLLN